MGCFGSFPLKSTCFKNITFYQEKKYELLGDIARIKTTEN